jgi:hypothetical protein
LRTSKWKRYYGENESWVTVAFLRVRSLLRAESFRDWRAVLRVYCELLFIVQGKGAVVRVRGTLKSVEPAVEYQSADQILL